MNPNSLRFMFCLFCLSCVFPAGFLQAQAPAEEFGFGARFVDEQFKLAHTVKLPEVDARAHYDWRDDGAVTVAGNQGSCGACWAFTLTGVMESKIFLEYGTLHRLSPQFINSCAPATAPVNGYGCCGSWATAYNFYVYESPVHLNELPFADGWSPCEELDCPPTCSNVACDLTKPRVGIYAQPDSLFFVDENNPAQVISLIEV